MGWTTVDLANVNPNIEVIPEGAYTFRLAPGTFEDEAGRLIVTAHIASEGDFNGRKITFSYPSPERAEWSDRMVKRLQEALGLDSVQGENPVAFLNRAAGYTFGGKMKHQEYTPEGAVTPRKTSKLDIFNLYPAV